MKRLQAHWLLVAALLLTQALGVAHAFDHPALGHTDHACAVCAHGQGLDHVPPAAAAALPLPVKATPPIAAQPAVRRETLNTGYHSRAPPLFA